MISGIEKRFFEGAGNQGKNPKYSLTDVDNENFRLVIYTYTFLNNNHIWKRVFFFYSNCFYVVHRTVGEIMAVSLAQGGPPPAFLREWCYNFLCTGEVDLNSLSQEDVTDLESRLLISRVSILFSIVRF